MIKMMSHLQDKHSSYILAMDESVIQRFGQLH